MTDQRSGSDPDEEGKASWANEGLPLSVRKELLERDLKKLGARAGVGVPAAATLQETPRDADPPGSERPG